MKQFLLSVSLLIGAAVNAQDCSELFISEYVEGWSNNKALEIYNPTNQSINLSEYIIIRYSNGATSAGQQQSVQLDGTIEAFGTYVAVIDKRDPDGIGQEAPVWDDLQAKADGFYCPDYLTSNAMYFNGNDVVVLAKGDYTDPTNSQVVDIFGKFGEDPDNGECDPDQYGTCGWTTAYPFVSPSGEVVTTDHSLIRKSTVLNGQTDPTLSDEQGFFDPLAEWDSIPPLIFDEDLGYNVGNWESLGTHECNCEFLSVSSEEAVNASIYPNPSANGEFNVKVNAPISSIVVIDALGQEVFSENNSTPISTINIGAKTGVYFVNILTVDGVFITQKVIVK